jgi:hypothetical protein
MNTRKNLRKFFAKENAHAEGILKFLLWQILHPMREHVGRGGGGKRKPTNTIDFDEFLLIKLRSTKNGRETTNTKLLV